MAAGPAANRARAGEVVINLAAHHCCLTDYGFRQVGRMRRRRVHHHGQRGFERVGQIAGVRARFLRLPLRMRQQCIEFLHQGLHFERQRFGHPVGPGVAHPLDRAAHPAQGAKSVPGLQRRHNQQAQPQNGQAAQQCPAHLADLPVQIAAPLGHRKAPDRIAAGQSE